MDELFYEAGPNKGEQAVIPAGEYRVRYADADTQKQYAGATETPVDLEGTHVAEYGSRSGGCDVGGFGGAALLALAVLALKGKGRK